MTKPFVYQNGEWVRVGDVVQILGKKPDERYKVLNMYFDTNQLLVILNGGSSSRAKAFCVDPSLVCVTLIDNATDENNMDKVNQVKPMRTFAEMEEAIVQYNQGLVLLSELIAALQCVPHQIDVLVEFNRLPAKVIHNGKISLLDWDTEVAERCELGIKPRCI